MPTLLYFAGALLVGPLSLQVNACGPDFPNYILDDGVKDLLRAPVADFARELERLQLRPPAFRAVQTTNDSFATDTTEAELSELRTAVRKAGVTAEEAKRIVEGHRESRRTLENFSASVRNWPPFNEPEKAESTSIPMMPEIGITEGLPPEFADYFRGAIVWHNPAISNKAAAHAAWERVLALPAVERKYKSTWSAYMLGRYWAKDEPEKAREYFQQVRDLARKGFRDPLGLAAASIGWEAKTYYDHTNYTRATELYLEQYATDDNTAINSLLTAIGRALTEGSETELLTLATNEASRRAVTAYLISRSEYFYMADYSDSNIGEKYAGAWLKAVERADVRDMASAEVIGLAAYRAGKFEAAQRWIDRAKTSPTAQWLQAKLLLRAGKLDQAAILLAKVSQSFPTVVALTNPPATLAENLFAPGRMEFDYTDTDTTAGREVLAEIGVLKLARREFVASLDALLNAGFWMDAAYVAERVLTTDELKTYVDDKWPVPAAQSQDSQPEDEDSKLRLEMAGNIRYLLGRRLTREKRGHEAREYFPAEWRSQFDQLIAALQGGQDETLPAEERGRRLFAAAIIARTNGLELVGTEVSPDWRVYDGDFEGSVTIETRTNKQFGIVQATELEMERAFRHATDPDARFHYRWQAAYLGWAAAQLLPDNSDETALVLCRSGSWLKNIDPKVADIFYKSLVKRCRKTRMGEEADRIRWFPKLDEQGQWIPRAQQPAHNESEGPAGVPANPLEVGTEMQSLPASGEGGEFREYMVHAGDSVGSIARACGEAGLSVTVKALVAANPEISEGRLRIGQRLKIPAK